MSNGQPRSEDEERHWRTVRILRRVMANEELMAATRDGVEETVRGVPGVPLSEVREAIRRAEPEHRV